MAGATPAAPTWLDRQLIGGAPGAADKGFGGELREALRQRSDFLIEQGLAARRGLRLVLARNLLGSLRQRDLDAAARGIAGETGMPYRPAVDGEGVSGVYGPFGSLRSLRVMRAGREMTIASSTPRKRVRPCRSSGCSSVLASSSQIKATMCL